MGLNWSGGASGAASGAAAGTAINPGWGTAIGAGLGGLAGLFGGNPEDEANEYLKKIPDQMRPYFDPYFNAGKDSLGKAQGAYGDMMNDPNAIISRLGAGYQQSPGFKFQMQQGENSINNANAAGGMLGTGQHEQMAGQFANDLANKDYNQYLDHALGIYGAGVQGQQNIANMGQTAGNEFGTSLGNLGTTRAGLAYEGSLNKNKQQSDLMSSILSYLKNKGP